MESENSSASRHRQKCLRLLMKPPSSLSFFMSSRQMPFCGRQKKKVPHNSSMLKDYFVSSNRKGRGKCNPTLFVNENVEIKVFVSLTRTLSAAHINTAADDITTLTSLPNETHRNQINVKQLIIVFDTIKRVIFSLLLCLPSGITKHLMKIYARIRALPAFSHGPLMLVIQLFPFIPLTPENFPNDHRLFVPPNSIPWTTAYISWGTNEREEDDDFVSWQRQKRKKQH